MPSQVRFRRFFEASALALGACLFLIYGVVTMVNGAVVFGVGFIAVGAIGGIAAATYFLRGARLGVEIAGDSLVVHHYFSEKTVLLKKINRLYRSVDATVLETTDGIIVIDDAMFSDPQNRDALFTSLENQLRKQSRE